MASGPPITWNDANNIEGIRKLLSDKKNIYIVIGPATIMVNHIVWIEEK